MLQRTGVLPATPSILNMVEPDLALTAQHYWPLIFNKSDIPNWLETGDWTISCLTEGLTYQENVTSTSPDLPLQLESQSFYICYAIKSSKIVFVAKIKKIFNKKEFFLFIHFPRNRWLIIYRFCWAAVYLSIFFLSWKQWNIFRFQNTREMNCI